MSRALRLFSAGCILGVFLFFVAVPVEAKKTAGDALGQLSQTIEPTGLDTNDNFSSTVGTFIQIALSVVGITFFGLMVYGGFRWLTSRGEDGDIETAKKTITASIIGICIIVAAFAITSFVTDRLISGAGVEGDANPDVTGTPGTPGAGALGCCMDKVSSLACMENLLTLDCMESWAWRITTAEDCALQGSNPPPNNGAGADGLYGSSPTYWQFYPGIDASECNTLWEEM